MAFLVGIWLTHATFGQANRQAKLASTQRPAAVKALSEQEQRSQISQAIARARAAKTIDEFTQALLRCQQLYGPGLTEQNRQYLRQLSAWLYVRRGEKYADEAAALAERNDDANAQQYEQLALKDFENSLKAVPTWRAYHNRGISHAMLGDFDAALDDFSEAITQNPKKFASTFFNRGEIYFELADYESAERDYDEAHRIEPSDISALIGRAHARYQAGKTDKALQDFDEIIRLQPDEASAYADRADLYAYLGQWEKAAADYQKAIKMDKSLGRAYQSVAWMMATCPDDRFRHPDFALKAARRAIELDGDEDYRYLDTLAAAEASASHFDQAQEAVKRAIERAPEELRAELTERLALYQAKKAYRETR
jgi:tetratricopeptide (TPR) repeat protein